MSDPREIARTDEFLVIDPDDDDLADAYEAEVFRRRDGLFDWRLFADNGEQVCESSQGYTEANDAREGFARMVHAVVVQVVTTEGPATARPYELLREAVADA